MHVFMCVCVVYVCSCVAELTEVDMSLSVFAHTVMILPGSSPMGALEWQRHTHALLASPHLTPPPSKDFIPLRSYLLRPVALPWQPAVFWRVLV